MRQALYTDTTSAGARQIEQDYREDDTVWSDEAVLAHLEADTKPEIYDDGDPIKGIAIGTLLGTTIWVASTVVLALFM